MPPYKIQFVKTIWVDENHSAIFDHLYREIELPFLPFIGLAIQDFDGWSSESPIEALTWNGEKQHFFAWVAAEAGDDDRSAEDIRHWDMKYMGWLSHKVKAAD